MKTMKCYGHQQVPKEKSFIKNFFDGNKSSEISFLNSSTEKENIFVIDSDSSDSPGEVVAESDSNSPHLFDEYVFEKKLYEKSKCFDTSNDIKTKQVKKKRKCVKQKKFVQRKPKGIQHLSTKFCKSHQPCWSEINSHNFTVESQRGYIKPAFTGKPSNIQNRKTISRSKYSVKNLQENVINRKPSASTENDLSSNNIRSKKSKMCFSSHENVDSSGDLFLSTVKVKKPVVKKITRIENNNNDFIDKKENWENFLKSGANELEEKINQCMVLVDPPSVTEKSSLILENSFQKKYGSKLAPHSSDLVSETEDVFCQSTNPPLLVHIANKSSLKDKKTCDLNKISVLENVDAENGSLLNFDVSRKTDDDLCQKISGHKKCTPVNVNDLQNNSITKQNCSELDQNLNKDSGKDIVLQVDNSLCIPEKICSKENLEVNISDIALSANNNINNKIDISPIIHSKSLSVCTSGPGPNKLCKLDADISFSDKKCIQGSEISKSNVVAGKKFQNVALNTDLECSKIKESCDISKISVHLDKEFHVNISPSVSFVAECLKSSGNQPFRKFLTSTPVIKNKCINACDAKFSLFSHKSTDHSKDTELQEKPSYNGCLNASMCDEIHKSLPLLDCPSLVLSKKSSTLPKVNMADSVSLKKNSSLLNLSQLPDKEDSHQFSRADLLKLCDQDSVASFADIYNWKKYKIEKIGEGTYGEVFMITTGKKSVLKIIPVSEEPTIRHLQSLASVYSEVKITKCLSELRNNQRNQSPNFTKLIRVSAVSGAYPAELISAWDLFNDSTYNDRPDVYSSEQLFIILELEYGGKDLSHLTINNAVEAESILKQIAMSLAIAEEEFSFEHRDLHLGNILLDKSNVPKTCAYKLRGQDISFPSHGVRVIIIDFTLSLLHENGYVYYNDLAEDISLFEQSGDYQFEVYKAMRNHLENKWQDCSLYSNILWLKYLCQKMKEHKYKNYKSKRHKNGLIAIDYFNNQLLNCNCALECLARCGITENAYKRTAIDRKNSILVSRNSIQKSKLSIYN